VIRLRSCSDQLQSLLGGRTGIRRVPVPRTVLGTVPVRGQSLPGALQPLVAYKDHLSGTPFRACSPRSSNAIPEPATRSRTVRVTSTSPGDAADETRAPMWTAIPVTSPLRLVTSPVCRPQ